ncbi:MAG TPA: S-adenosylmethionine decarboxylase [Candidatus Bathyarchaeia archaeon]|nr:S-adenosylmethionine decarboxylase [Candidatus Bathyarchaeia archaeon]
MKEYRRINVDGVIYYGKHLILTAHQCNENLLDKAKMASFVRQLVDKIDMVAFGDPIVERFGQGIEIGLSGVQLIETSAITFHTNDQARDMYLDVFSCKAFPEDVVCQFVKETLQPLSTNYQVLLR